MTHPFVKWYLLTIVLLLVALTSFVSVIDPYALQGHLSLLPRHYKIKTLDTQRLTKAHDIAHIKPRAILLGSSRILEGFNSKDIGQLLNLECYNLGLSGANIEELHAYFNHALYHQPDLQVVLLGLDLFAFNDHRDVAPDFSQNLLCSEISFTNYLAKTLSRDAVVSSIKTLKYCRRHLRGKELYRQFLDHHGNIPAETIAFHAAKRHPSFADREKSALNMWFKMADNYGHFKLSQKGIALLEDIVSTCQAKGIALYVFFNPCRAIYWHGIYEKSLWPTLDALKRELVNFTPVWDFSGCNAITCEAFHDSDETAYFDCGHFRPIVGEKIVRTILKLDDNPWGTLMTPDNIDLHLTQLREKQLAWAAANPTVVSFLKGAL